MPQALMEYGLNSIFIVKKEKKKKRFRTVKMFEVGRKGIGV